MRLILTFAVFLLLSSPTSHGQTIEDFAGAWGLVSIERLGADGGWNQVPGPGGGAPAGLLMYDHMGNMSVQITSQPKSIDLTSESLNAMVGYLAYYGTFEIDHESQTVIHHRQQSINPIRTASSALRRFDFEDGTLTLTVIPEGDVRLNWQRLK